MTNVKECDKQVELVGLFAYKGFLRVTRELKIYLFSVTPHFERHKRPNFTLLYNFLAIPTAKGGLESV